MTIEEALTAHLVGYSPLHDLIDDRVDPGQLKLRSQLPAITYQRISRKTTQHRSSRKARHSRPRFQFDVWASTYASVVATRNALIDAMADFVRDSDPRVDVALLQDDRDAYESEPGRWRAIVDYYIWHTED